MAMKLIETERSRAKRAKQESGTPTGTARTTRAALRRLEEEILRDHVAHCVEHAIASGNKADQRRKVEELMEVVSRSGR